MTFGQSMNVAVLAHGGEMSGDEMALMGGGLAAAVLFPAAVLLFVIRKSKRQAGPETVDAEPELRTANVANPSTPPHRHSLEEQP